MVTGKNTAIVLAGGKAKRFGRNKLGEQVGGRSLLENVLHALSSFSDRIIVVIAPGQSPPPVRGSNISIVTDLIPGKSALGGIYTGLVESRTFHSLVIAADMPMLNVPLLRHMLDVAPGYDAVIPRIDDALEPLHAVYSRNCLDPMRQLIDAGELRIRLALDHVKVRWMEAEEIDRYDPMHLSFFNVNTQADLDRARQALGEAGAGEVDADSPTA